MGWGFLGRESGVGLVLVWVCSFWCGFGFVFSERRKRKFADLHAYTSYFAHASQGFSKAESSCWLAHSSFPFGVRAVDLSGLQQSSALLHSHFPYRKKLDVDCWQPFGKSWQ